MDRLRRPRPRLAPARCTFLERLVALVPHPREHQWTYFGILAPASPLRDAVVPRRTVASSGPSPGPRRAPGIGEPEAIHLRRVAGRSVTGLEG